MQTDGEKGHDWVVKVMKFQDGWLLPYYSDLRQKHGSWKQRPDGIFLCQQATADRLDQQVQASLTQACTIAVGQSSFLSSLKQNTPNSVEEDSSET